MNLNLLHQETTLVSNLWIQNAEAEGSQMWKLGFSTGMTNEITSAVVLIDGWLTKLTILRLASMPGGESMSGQ